MFFYPYKFITFASVMALCIRERVKCVCFTVIMVCMFVSCTRQGTDASVYDYRTLLANELTVPENLAHPENLISIITEKGVDGSLSKEEAAYYRAMVYLDLDMDIPKAAQECFSILESRFVRRNPQVHMRVYEILSVFYHQNKQFKLSMESALLGQRLAQTRKDSVMTAVFSYIQAKSQIDLGSGYYYDHLEKLIPVLEQSQDRYVQHVLAHVYADEIGDRWDVEDFGQVTDYGTRCLNVIEKLGYPKNLDALRCSVASVLARSYHALGQDEKAKKAFEQDRKSVV